MRDCNYILLLVLVTFGSLFAQDRLQLEQERMQVIESIEETDKLIAASESDRQKSLQTLAALRGQIDQRNLLLENIRKSIRTAELEIESNYKSIDSLMEKVADMEKQYASLLRSKYIKKRTSPSWLTILSASNINEAFLRWNYNRQFESYRNSKIEELSNIKSSMNQTNEEIKNYALENSVLIQEQQLQNSELQKRIGQQNDLVKELQKDKSILQSQLLAIKQSRESLNKAIESRVLGELSGAKLSSDDSNWNNDNIPIVKGKVMLPITIGYKEDLSLNVAAIDNTTKSQTASIYAANGAKVISIAPGKVVSVKNVEGYGNMIILQHGDFYSIYANLNTVDVKAGNSVDQNEKLGTVEKEKNRLHFELWKDKVRLNANEWLED